MYYFYEYNIHTLFFLGQFIWDKVPIMVEIAIFSISLMA